MKKLLFLLVLMLSMTVSSAFSAPQVAVVEDDAAAMEGIIIDRTNWTVKASTEEPAEGSYGGQADRAIDNNKESFWHTQWQNAKPTVPHWIQFDMAETYEITAFDYVSRTANTNGCNGNVKKYKLYISNNDISATIDATSKVPAGLEPVMEGEFVYNGEDVNHLVSLPEVVEGRYVYMLITETYNTDPNIQFANCAEFNVYRYGVAAKYAVTAVVLPVDCGTATVNDVQSAEVAENSFVKLKAVANNGYEFINWTKNGQFVSFEATAEVPVTETAEYVAHFAEIVEETEYVVTESASGTHSRTDRRLASFEISNGVENVKVKGVVNGGSAYVNRSKYSVLSVQPGDVVTFPEFNWVGEWMHAYAYIDYNNDKKFNTSVNNDGTTAGELVTYNCYNAKDINGNTASEQYACTKEYTNSYGTSKGLPAFKLPEIIEPGEYRMRVCVAWNTLSPNGYDAMIENGGCLLDMTLLVGASDKYYVRVSAADNNGKVYIGTENTTTTFVANDGEQTVVLKAEGNENYDFLNWTLNGEVVSTNAEYTTTAITENRDYVANFVYNKYVVTVSAANNNGKVYIDNENISTKNVANDGEQTVVLKAVGNENYDFLNWTLNGEVVSTDAEYTTTAITENRNYIANFVFAGKCYLDSDVADGEGSIVFYDENGNVIEDKVSSGTKVRVVVTPAEGYLLDAVYYNDEEMEITDPASWTLEVVVTADIIVEVYFEENAEASVEETVVDAAQVSVAGRTIVVNGYTGAVRVVNVCGQTVAEVAANGKAEINVARGIYIVVAGSQANKVLVK